MVDDPDPQPAELDPTYYQHERYLGPRRRSPVLSAYYAAKPLLPRAVQLRLRRLHSMRRARRSFPSWPNEPVLVDHEAQLRSRMPAPVEYWPGGAPWACILTHDVEGPLGVRNIDRVLEIEQRHGLRSSWNFVAEDYPIPSGLFERLRSAGCEIGLHAVHHDGRLFASRASFEANLPKIHRYLRDWEAVGFRSPATHRRAEWMHELGCLYDSSYPDTDPFEPQAGGCCSIRPFFFGDVVELPITLVQDHTLWEILRQSSIDLWLGKASWIMAHEGLINIITHPDYFTTPARLQMYDAFLSFVTSHGAGWHALPREVAGWWRVRDAQIRAAGAGGQPAHIAAEPRSLASRPGRKQLELRTVQ